MTDFAVFDQNESDRACLRYSAWKFVYSVCWFCKLPRWHVVTPLSFTIAIGSWISLVSSRESLQQVVVISYCFVVAKASRCHLTHFSRRIRKSLSSPSVSLSLQQVVVISYCFVVAKANRCHLTQPRYRYIESLSFHTISLTRCRLTLFRRSVVVSYYFVDPLSSHTVSSSQPWIVVISYCYIITTASRFRSILKSLSISWIFVISFNLAFAPVLNLPLRNISSSQQHFVMISQKDNYSNWLRSQDTYSCGVRFQRNSEGSWSQDRRSESYWLRIFLKHPKPYTLNPKHKTKTTNPKCKSLWLRTFLKHPKPYTLNHKLLTKTTNPKKQIILAWHNFER